MTVEMAVAIEIGAYAVDGDNAAVLFALLVVVVMAAVQVVVKDVIAVDAVGVALDLRLLRFWLFVRLLWWQR